MSIQAECRPCSYATCPIGHLCARMVKPQAVVREAEGLISRWRTQAA